MRKLTFHQACAQYVHRYTMEHVPTWARKPAPNGKYYAPHFSTDREWYEKTKFVGESELADKYHCYTSGESWPKGQWLDAPFYSVKGA
jgi:hypothetical protein